MKPVSQKNAIKKMLLEKPQEKKKQRQKGTQENFAKIYSESKMELDITGL